MLKSNEIKLWNRLRCKKKPLIEQPTKQLKIDPVANIINICSSMSKNNIFIQDVIHILTKLRNRFFKFSILMPIGSTYVVPNAHVKVLMSLLTKDKHNLTERDVYYIDKMNFNSVKKVFNCKIQNYLKSHVPAIFGTQIYFKIVYYIMNAFLSKKLNILQNILHLEFSIFIETMEVLA